MTDTRPPNVGKRLRAMRQARGWSTHQLERVSGLSSSAISLIERGEVSPKVRSLHLLALAFDVPITAFFEGEGSEPET